jgi:ATP-dependent DNA helicase RecQ
MSTPSKDELLKTLKTKFGFSGFREGQYEVISTLLAPESYAVLFVSPTGSGKSLIYQLSSYFIEGLCIVVSPLISLMKDQVDDLQKNGLSAAFVNSTQSKGEQDQIFNAIQLGILDILYVAPERFENNDFIEFISQFDIGLFAVDEAHCISEWGHDFRKAYTRLNNAIYRLNPKRVVALTATATPDVQKDICKSLGVPNIQKMIYNVYRTNLHIDINQIDDTHEEVVRNTKKLLKTYDSGIIYCQSRKQVDELMIMFENNKLDAYDYHAGMGKKDRDSNQQNWKNNGGVIISTCAFGMGIDKKDVRFVTHVGFPNNLESYYQEIGRAGRDGLDSIIQMFYNGRHKYLAKFLIDISFINKKDMNTVINYLTYNIPDGIIKTNQATLGEFLKVKSISKAFQILYECKILVKLEDKSYKIVAPVSSSVIFNSKAWAKNESEYQYRLQKLNVVASFLRCDTICRMKQICEYFGQSDVDDCKKCDACCKKYGLTRKYSIL